MAYKLNISDLSLNQLNAACLMKISQFAVALEKFNGTILELTNDDLMRELVKIAKSTNDLELKFLYVSIKQEISKHINSAQFDRLNTDSSGLNVNTFEPYRSSSPADKKH